MEKGFWNLKTEQRKVTILILCIGVLVTFGMAVRSYQGTKILNQRELEKKKAGEGTYEQEVIAQIEGGAKIPLTVVVEEQLLTKEEADRIFKATIESLEEIILGENESFQKITKDLHLVSSIPETPVEVTWRFSEYFHSDGRIREDVEILEPVELKLSAVLSCQVYTKEYEKKILLFPKEQTIEKALQEQIRKIQTENPQSVSLQLPNTYGGKEVVWRKPLDKTFLYFGFLTLGAVLFLKVGRKRDEQLEKSKRMEELEKDYAQIVSKFSMLFTAGLSIRNAWERIVLMERRRQGEKKVIGMEMSWALREMQKGIPELEVYERFGSKIGLVHYKKLMAIFVSHKRRGGAELLELMNEEMLLAWEEKKRKARQQGEKIGTKLLLPMMGMLTVVFIMILVPAFLSFQM